MVTKEVCETLRDLKIANEKLYARLSELHSRPDRYTEASRAADKVRGDLLAEIRHLNKLIEGPAWRRWFASLDG